MALNQKYKNLFMLIRRELYDIKFNRANNFYWLHEKDFINKIRNIITSSGVNNHFDEKINYELNVLMKDMAYNFISDEIIDHICRAVVNSFELEDSIFQRLAFMEEKISARLDGIERSIEKCGHCAFVDSQGNERYPEFITALAPPASNRDQKNNQNTVSVKGDAEKFITVLKAVANRGAVLVLVDPYALSDEDDEKKKSSTHLLDQLISAGSFEAIHIYCREDAFSINVFNKICKPNKKIHVYFGDIHDRCMFVGGDDVNILLDRRTFGNKFSKENLFDFCESKWHGKQMWGGLVFGASLNGVAKRPTYILNFERNDIEIFSSYLNNVCKKRPNGEIKK